MNGRINDLMTRLGDKGSFTKVAPTQEMLAEVEEKLGFIVLEQFLEYLNIYSHGGIGFEILGVGFDGSISFLEETLEYRVFPTAFSLSRTATNGCIAST